jgi:hypothetical protein
LESLERVLDIWSEHSISGGQRLRVLGVAEATKCEGKEESAEGGGGFTDRNRAHGGYAVVMRWFCGCFVVVFVVVFVVETTERSQRDHREG